jgi:hypothetical protein
MARTTVTGLQFKDGDIQTIDIANLAVTAEKIATNTITHDKVATVNIDGLATTPSMRTLGNGALQAAAGNDFRLSDARAPIAHSHGNITNTGLIGVVAGLPLITGTGGLIQLSSFGTAALTFAQGNDSRINNGQTAFTSLGNYLPLTGGTLSGNLNASGTRLITNFVIDTHPESSTAVIPFIHNDIAYLRLRGGTATDNFGNANNNLFDGSPSYTVFNNTDWATSQPGGYVLEAVFHKTFLYSNKIGVSFGNVNWRSKYVKIEVFDVSTNAYRTVLETSTNDSQILQVSASGPAPSYAISKMRMTFNDFNGYSGSGFRLAQIWLLNYSSQGAKETLLGRDGGTLYGNVTAPTFIGNLTGNVTGGLTGNVTGSLTGNVTGDVIGSAEKLSNVTIQNINTITNGTLGSQVQDAFDFNLATNSGVYEVIWGGFIANSPQSWTAGSNHYGLLVCDGRFNSRLIQTISESSGPASFYRVQNGSVWGAWTSVITSGNIGSQSVNYANAAGTATPNNDSNLVHKTGDETIFNVKNFADKLRIKGEIFGQGGSSAALQVNGFQRTGNIYLHAGGNAPDGSRTADVISNEAGVLTWLGVGSGTVLTSGNFVAGTESVNYAVGNDSRINNGQTAFDSLASYLPLTGGDISGGLTISGSLSRGTYASQSNYKLDADNIVLKGNANGVSGIFFESEKNGVSINHPTDFGFIQYNSYGTATSGEANELIIGVSNDGDDHVIFNAPAMNGLKFRLGASTTDYDVYHVGNFTSGIGATNWTAGNDTRVNNGQTAFSSLGNYLPLTGGNLSGKITFNTNNIDNGFLWNVNSDQAGITFKNSGDGDTNSNLNFFTKDNGNEYFKFSHTTWNTGTLDYVDIKNGSIRVNGELYANALQSGDVTLGTNTLVGGNKVWHAGNFVAGIGSANYAAGDDQRILNGQTAFSWGNHALAGYLTAETDSQSLSWVDGTNTLSISNGNSVVIAGFADSVHDHTFASLTAKPTTLSGYGITDTPWTSYLPLIGGTLSGDLNISDGQSGGIHFRGGTGARMTSVSSTDVVFLGTREIRLSDSTSWDWNSWGGISYINSAKVMYIGGMAGSKFTSNASPAPITIDMTLVNAGVTSVSADTFIGALIGNVNGTATPNNDSNLVHRTGNETVAGIKTFTGTTFFGSGQIQASGAALQVNGFQRTGNIYLHTGGNTPDTARGADLISNISGNLTWTGLTSGTVYHSGNFVAETNYQTPQTTLSGYRITDAYTKTQIDISLLTSSRNLIANNAYSSSVVGYQYTSGRNLVTGQNNRINLSKGAAVSSYIVKTPGYYSVSFWYMVSSFVSSGTNVVQVNDVSFTTISITGNVAWTFYSGTIYVDGYINGLGFFDMEQTGNSLITVSDIVLTRSSQPSQQYYPAPEDYQTPQTTLSGYGITDAYTQTTANAKFVDFTTAQSITGVKIFSNGLIDNVTNIGKTVTPYTVIPTGGWAKAVGTSIFSQSTSVGSPGIVGYWATLGRRDFAGGYSGIYSGYNGADSYLGSAADGANNPIWQKILTEANFISGAGSTNYAAGDDERIRNGQAAFTSLASYLPLSGGLMSGTIARSTSVAGYQVGSYNIATNDLKSNPIYTIGTNYMPSDTTLGNMFGIGYTHASASFINSTDLGVTPSAWGQYVAAGGKAKIFFEANNGNIYAKNNIYAQDGVFRGNISALGGTSAGWNSAFNWGNHAAAGYYLTALISAAKAYSNVSTFTVPASMPESWIRVYSGGGLKLLSLHISCNYDNTSSIEEIKATVSGYGMFHHLKSTTSNYNASRLLEVKTTDLQNGIAEIWIRIGASTVAGTVKVSSSESIPTLAIATPVFSGSNAVSLVYTNRRTNSMLITRGIEIDGNSVFHGGNFVAGTDYQTPSSDLAFKNVNNNFSVAQTFASSVTATDGIFSGNVGIGTTTPYAKLEVRGTILSTKNVINNFGDGSALDLVFSGVTVGEVRTRDYDLLVGTPTGGGQALAFQTNGIERARFANSTGNFLINTTTDNGSKLQVTGAATFTSSVTATKGIFSNPGVSGALDFNMTVHKSAVADANGSSVGILFSTEGGSSDSGKGAIVFERTGSYARGTFHFLSSNTIDSVKPTLADSKFSINSLGAATFASSVTATSFIGDATDTTKLPLIGGTTTGTVTMYSDNTGGGYNTRAIELREVGLVTNTQSSPNYAPSIGFHWGSRVQAQIALRSSGILMIRTDAGDGSEIIHAGNISQQSVSYATSAGIANNLVNGGGRPAAAGSQYINIDSTNGWAYLSLRKNGATIWDIAQNNGGSLEFRSTGTAVTMSLSSAGAISLNGKSAIDGSDLWLRINQNNNFSNGIYCGTGILRTDGPLQVGGNGASFLANGSGTTIGTLAGTTNVWHLFYGSDTTTSGRLRATTGGNVHLDSSGSGILYLNYYTGSGGVYFGNGATGANAYVTAAGAFTGTNFSGAGTGLTGTATSFTAGSAINATSADALSGVALSRIVYGDGARGRSVVKTGLSANTLGEENSSGFYFGNNTTGMPTTDWWNWNGTIGNSWGTTDGYGFQTAGSFWSDDFRMRRLTSGTWQPWVSLIHSGTIGSQSVNYANSSGSASTAAEATNNFFIVRGTSPTIQFVDTDQGQSRYMHHNGGSIGFLNATGSWTLRIADGAGYMGGSFAADSFVKTGGSGTQFLMADGSVSSGTTSNQMPSSVVQIAKKTISGWLANRQSSFTSISNPSYYMVEEVRAVLICKVANNSYAVGDKATILNGQYPTDSGRTAGQGITIQFSESGTFINYSIGEQLTIANKVSGTNAYFVVSPSQWDIVFNIYYTDRNSPPPTLYM